MWDCNCTDYLRMDGGAVMNQSYLLLILVFSPLLGVVALFLLPKQQEQVIKRIGILATLPSFILAMYLFFQYKTGQSLFNYHFAFKWFQIGNFKEFNSELYTVQFALGLNNFSMLMVMMTTILTLLSAIASTYVKQAWKGYFILFLLLQVSMIGVFTADSLFLFFLFFECTFVAMFFLISRWGFQKKEKAALHFLIYNGLGSAILFIVIIILFAYTGTDQIEALQQIIPDLNIADSVKMGLLVALLVAFGIKIPIVPFHSWMLSVHVQAPTPIVMLHAGVLLKIGAYGIIRFGIDIFPEQFESLSYYLIIIGILNLLYGAFLAFVQKDFKMVLAYSSVSHMGIVLMGLGAINEAGLQGALFQVISHGLIAAMFFFLVGSIYEREQTSQLERLSGMMKRMPVLSGFLLLTGLATLGLPGMSGFISEFMVFLGLFQEHQIIGAIATLGLIMTAAYVLRAIMTMLFGTSEELSTDDIRMIEWFPLLFLTVLIIAIGVYPALLADVLDETVRTMLLRMGG